MSDTPRTDALHHRTCAFGDGFRMAALTDLCRELERELAAVTAENQRLREELENIRDAKPYSWGFGDAEENLRQFHEWTQSRTRFALNAASKLGLTVKEAQP